MPLNCSTSKSVEVLSIMLVLLHQHNQNKACCHSTLLLSCFCSRKKSYLLEKDEVSSLKVFLGSPCRDLSAVTSVCPCIRLTGASHSAVINRVVCPVTCSCTVCPSITRGMTFQYLKIQALIQLLEVRSILTFIINMISI